MIDQIAEICRISREAGAAILAIYAKTDHGVETKSDDSPLTAADMAAHRIIVSGLEACFPDIPVLSEESGEIDYETRAAWSRYFLVDPLDGTKEFISRNGEFTVNIALVDNGLPRLGVVYVPVKDLLYVGYDLEGEKAAYVEQAGQRKAIRTRTLADHLAAGEALTVVASRRHGGEALEACMAVLSGHFDKIDTTNMGSSLKLCLVAEGKADLYPRLAPTSEWDTAAAHAIVAAAGGSVVDSSLAPLRYNTRPSLLNPHFFVLGDPGYPWLDLLADVSA